MKNGVWMRTRTTDDCRAHFVEIEGTKDLNPVCLCGCVVHGAMANKMKAPHCKRCEKKLKGGK